jgi:Uma2 family endonuclease
MPPEGPLHTLTNINAVKYLRSLLNGLAEVREAHPITLSNSEPEPDVAIVRLPDTTYLTRHPQPNDIYWVIEIADRTLTIDLGRKKKFMPLLELKNIGSLTYKPKN